MIVLFRSLVTFLILGVSLVSCSSVGTYEELVVDSGNSTEGTEFDYVSKLGEYLIGAEDTISINVWKNPELSVEVPVRPDGKVSMPLIGDVLAAGFTPEAVANKIQLKLENFVRNPNVTLMVTNLQSHEYLTRIRVTGAVNTQSSIKYRQGMTILDAILDAGSVNEFAAPNGSKLYRKIKDKVFIKAINLGDMLFKGKLENNIYLRPGDIITIPERLF
ncbi:FIG123464: Polysaccharide export protein [hydrothermal vent metagenome]|uniref:FIG123464: Polysaccharide export protein n=1 Tax=hydrothermal vent metagenome TaxID=652676 RepID=A0A3B0XN75_9ZZZZ